MKNTARATAPTRPDSSTIVWLLLLAVTCISIALEEAPVLAPLAATLVIIIGALKARLIFIHFMELKRDVLPYRIIFELWAILAVLIILVGYWYPLLAA